MRAKMLFLPFLPMLLGAADMPPSAWILTCNAGPPAAGSTAPTVRMFRLAKGVLQEWKPEQRTYGPNLCLSFPCKADRARLEGTVESRTVKLTLTFDRATGQATWRTAGATGHAQTSGPCRVKPEPATASAPGRAPAGA